MRTLKPDFKTIADFRSENRAALKAVFRQFTLLCKDLKLFGRELLAVDGTRIKAVNNMDKNFTRNSLEKFIKAVDERLEEYLKRLTKAMSRKPERTVRASRILLKRSRRCARSVVVTARCWRNSRKAARPRYR